MRNWSLRLTQIPFFRDDVWFDDKDNNISVMNEIAHRRGGKSKGISLSINRDIKRFLMEETIYKIRGDVDSENPVISFLAPTKVQARQIIWKYLLADTREFTGVKVNNSLLNITIPRPHIGDDITIALMASKNHDRSRGLKNFKIYLDEVQDAPADAIQSSIQPSLEDTRGKMVTTGTAKGEDHYYEHLVHYYKLGAPIFKFPITSTHIFTPKEIQEIRQKHTPDYFEREYMLNFRAAIEGSFFAEILKELKKEEGFYTADKEDHRTNILSIDIGVGKGFAAWTLQPNYENNTLEVQDYYEDYVRLGDLKQDLLDDKFYPDIIFAPHDVDTRQMASFYQTTNRDIIKEVFPESRIKSAKKSANKMADIANMGENLHMLRFPPKKTATDAHKGLRKLIEFARKKNEKTGQYMDEIDKSRGVDHAADALRTTFAVMGIKEGKFKYKYDTKIDRVDWRSKFMGYARQTLHNSGSVIRPVTPAPNRFNLYEAEG